MHITKDIWIEDIHTAIERCWLPANMMLHKYHLHGKSYNHKDVFDIISHVVLENICAEIIAALQNGTKTILYLNTKYDLRKSHFIGYGADTLRMVQRLENLIQKVIPAYVIKKPYPFYDEFIDRYKQKEADVIDEVERVNLKFEKNSFKPFNLSKVIKYIDKRGLKYLSTDYFQQVNNKLLAANK